MKRLVITGPRTASFDDAPVPECPPDGLLVKAIVTAISTGTELRVFLQVPIDDAGELLFPSLPLDRTPHENGYSMVGRVVEVGADVVGFSEGDRVFVPEPHKEYASVSADSAMKLPDAMPDDHAVFLNILGVGQLALRRGRSAPGENVAVIGMGVIGLGTLALCRALGFRTAGIDTDGHRLGVAEEIGADLVADPTVPGFAQSVSDWSNGGGADLVIEAASTWQATKTGMDIVRTGGTVVVVARHTDRPVFSPVSHPYFERDITLVTSYGYSSAGGRWDREASLSLTIDLISQGKLVIGPMINSEFQWNQLPEVYGRLDRGDSSLLGIVIRRPE